MPLEICIATTRNLQSLSTNAVCAHTILELDSLSALPPAPTRRLGLVLSQNFVIFPVVLVWLHIDESFPPCFPYVYRLHTQ